MQQSAEHRRFSRKLLQWYDQHGRKSLPWQRNRDPYLVWVSEIMLQQTQVKAVIPYFERFISRFPTIDSLASADSDTVMHHWSGLGYYARARNLHKAAGQIVSDHGSKFPENFDAVVALPGIGKSTAGAILAFCFGHRHAILDGNVKRVLTRFYAIEGFPGKKAIENSLWLLADQLTPDRRIGDYTQAIMDLGATLCSRSRPDCERCPMQQDCQAFASGTQKRYPNRKPKTVKKQKSVRMLVIRQPGGEILLQKRPPTGIWGGLWSLPEITDQADNQHVVESRFALKILDSTPLKPLQHGFTHFDLLIYPEKIEVCGEVSAIMDADQYLWYNPNQPQSVGLPAVITKLLHANLAERTFRERQISTLPVDQPQ